MVMAPLKRWMRRFLLGLSISLTAFIFYWLPLGDYLWNMGGSLLDHGVSRQTWREWNQHTVWLLNFFTGPPSDAEMVALFHRHRAELERLADGYGTGRCPMYSSTKNDCSPIEQHLGLVSDAHYWVVHSTLHALQGYRFVVPAQDWWRNTNPAISGWSKWYIHIPKSLSVSPLVRHRHTPTNSDEIMHRKCRHLKSSLDRPVPELMAEPYYSDECGYFPLGDGWYLVLWAHFSL